jgi:hypothetical protein
LIVTLPKLSNFQIEKSRISETNLALLFKILNDLSNDEHNNEIKSNQLVKIKQLGIIEMDIQLSLQASESISKLP